MVPASGLAVAVVPAREGREGASAGPEPVAWAGGRAAERGPAPVGTAAVVPAASGLAGKAPAGSGLAAVSGSAQVGPVRVPAVAVRAPVQGWVASAVRPARVAGRAPVA
ncbi:hypothetical protein Vlu01_39770 [Micromonospora lutea]|uniref:Uncharacterized protein n=1 Tax=Micromonospora lutea TaxID=419825 RepID=A0ABQ4IZJ4_9ACTN|nr:hypothetical protein Vlu01_39770 [Micromonospora lutea]